MELEITRKRMAEAALDDCMEQSIETWVARRLYSAGFDLKKEIFRYKNLERNSIIYTQ